MTSTAMNVQPRINSEDLSRDFDDRLERDFDLGRDDREDAFLPTNTGSTLRSFIQGFRDLQPICSCKHPEFSYSAITTEQIIAVAFQLILTSTSVNS